MHDVSTVLLAVPSRFLRSVLRELTPHISGEEIFVSATKGLEHETLLRMSEVITSEIGPGAKVAILSGPTFAREVAEGQPAAVAVAAKDQQTAGLIQQQLAGPTFRLYTNSDPIGVEIGAALKNVIAIGAGVTSGLHLGNNALAALITRGLAEITRLAVAHGGNPATLAGLAGLGDLVLTCTGELSRNRQVGIGLAQGRILADIVGSTKMIAEGVDTITAAVALARRLSVDMPITEQMNLILHHGKPAKDGMRDLMDRTLRSE